MNNILLKRIILIRGNIIESIERTCIKGLGFYGNEPLAGSDAAARGIKNGDIVKVYNERGTILAGAYVTERIVPGALSQDQGAKV